MAEIWKFPFGLSPRFTLPIPDTTRILAADLQEGQPCIWVLVHDVDAPTVERTFRCVTTGEEFDPYGLQHHATFQVGALVFHLFEEMPWTANGTMLDDATIDALAEEAERGYDVERRDA